MLPLVVLLDAVAVCLAKLGVLGLKEDSSVFNKKCSSHAAIGGQEKIPGIEHEEGEPVQAAQPKHEHPSSDSVGLEGRGTEVGNG